MREIKFRAFCKGVMYTNVGLLEDHVIPEDWDKWHHPDDAMFIPEAVMQFTGLTDKNGVDIYEGDLLKFKWSWDTDTAGAKKVEHKVASFGYIPVHPDKEHTEDKHWTPFYSESDLQDINNGEPPENVGWNKNMIVVGNIYQNPELLT